jgi:hypothetical protein
MATLDNLVVREALRKIEVPLGPRELPHRLLYGFPGFVAWLSNELPRLETGRLQAADPPEEQLYYIMHKWIAGREIKYDRMFKDLMPRIDEVWELKTADIRVFGWMYKPCVLIAVFGDYADYYKGPASRGNYTAAINKVKKERRNLDLDEPKVTGGTFDELVCV